MLWFVGPSVLSTAVERRRRRRRRRKIGAVVVVVVAFVAAGRGRRVPFSSYRLGCGALR